MPMGLIVEPPYIVNLIAVGCSGGLTASLLKADVGSTLASAPVSNLQVMLPLGVVNFHSHAACSITPSIFSGSTSSPSL